MKNCMIEEPPRECYCMGYGCQNCGLETEDEYFAHLTCPECGRECSGTCIVAPPPIVFHEVYA